MLWEAGGVHGSRFTYILRRDRVGLSSFGFRVTKTVSNVGVIGCIHTYRDRRTRATYRSYILGVRSCGIGFVGFLTE